MSDPRNPLPIPQPLNPTRRRLLPLASTAAVLGLAGCALTGGGGGGSTADVAPVLEPVPAAMTPQQRTAHELVRQYTDNLDVALDRVDRERLRAAAEKKNAALVAAQAPVIAPTPAAVTPAAVTPVAAPATMPSVAAEPTPAAGAQASVILASSTHAEPAPAAQPAKPAPPAAPRPAPSAPAAAATPASSHSTPPAAPSPVAIAKAGNSAAALEKAIAPSAPAAPAPKRADVQATPVIKQTPSSAVITPITIAPSSTPAAMGAMTAVLTPAPDAAAPAPPVATTPVLAAAPAVPPAPPAAPPPEPTLEDAMTLLRKRVSSNPTLNAALALALLDPADAHASDLAKSLPETDQKLFADLLPALQGMGSPAAGTSAADRAAPLLTVAKKWQADADLALPKLVLATRVDSFGVYNAVEPRFEQGRKHTVIIYCEVANFSSSKSDDGWYQTRLSQQETLITDDGLLIWRPNAEEVEDRSMNHRRDFYLVKKLTIPENLAAGKYTLRMSVTDRNTNKLSMVSLPIEIVVK